jgi:hypothetical protein
VNKEAAGSRKLQAHFYCPVCAMDLHSIPLGNSDEMTMVPESEDQAAMGGNQLNPEDLDNLLAPNDMPDASTMAGNTEEDPTGISGTDTIMVSSKNKKKAGKSGAVPASQVKMPKGDGKKLSPKQIRRLARQAQRDADAAAANSDATTEGLKVAAKVNLLELAGNLSGLKGKELSLVPASPVLCYVFSSSKPVLTLNKDLAAPTVQAIFNDSDLMAKSLSVAIQEGSNLKDFGAKPVIISVKIPKIIKNRIAKAIRSEKARSKQALSRLEKNYFDALCVAAVALNKNVIEGKANPVKTALAESLTEIGVRQPSRIIDQAFKDKGDDMMREIMAYARDYIKKPKESRSEIVKFITKAAFVPTVEPETETNEAAKDMQTTTALSSLVSVISDSKNAQITTSASTPQDSTDFERFSRLLALR